MFSWCDCVVKSNEIQQHNDRKGNQDKKHKFSRPPFEIHIEINIVLSSEYFKSYNPDEITISTLKERSLPTITLTPQWTRELPLGRSLQSTKYESEFKGNAESRTIIWKFAFYHEVESEFKRLRRHNLMNKTTRELRLSWRHNLMNKTTRELKLSWRHTLMNKTTRELKLS